MPKRNDEFILRAHHGLCVNFFEGKGYSDKFSDNMKKVVDLLETDPEITIIKKGDNVCLHCPSNIDGICKSIEKVCRYDDTVLSLCEIKCNDKMKWSEYKNLVYNNILNKNKLSDVCSDCCWYNICSEKLKSIE